MFTTQRPEGIAACLSHVGGRVTGPMNEWLLQPFIVEEINKVLFQMHPLKSPGPNGFSVGFFQKAWPTVENEVTFAALSFLNGGHFDAGINSTNIVLIPKVSNLSKVTDYRPISLCKELFKIIAKALANMLKVVFPQLISSKQNAFISRRLITDNILVAFETLHTMDNRLKGN